MQVDAAAAESGQGWDDFCGLGPGYVFPEPSCMRTRSCGTASDYTFWGKGVSQGHSDAIRRIAGVKNAKQYTIPVESALEAVRNCENPVLTTRQKHTRECFVVARGRGRCWRGVEQEIKTMPNYFAEYDTTVHFISARRNCSVNHSRDSARRLCDPTPGKTGLQRRA